MRKIVSALQAFFCLCLLTLFPLVAQAGIGDADYCPPPDTIPFVHNGITYDYLIQVKAPNLTQYYFYGVSTNPKPVMWSFEHDPYHGLAVEGAEPFRVATRSPSTDCSGTISDLYIPGDGNYYNFIIYDGEPYFFSGGTNNIDYIIRSTIALTGTVNIAASVFGSGPVASYLSFLIQVNDPNGNPYTAYTTPVSAVMDHSMATPYAEDNIVLAFNGERGDRVYGFSQGCYKKSDGGDFGNGIKYVGTTGTGGKPYFCYDGHPGYDYPQSSGVDIIAPAAGKLCVATANITQQSPANVWRNTSECGEIPDVVTERWLNTGGFNAFYIFHTEYINGATDDYMTVFLHSNNLENTVVWSTVASQGYVNVTRGQYIADVGSVGAGNANHIHLEVYKKVSGVWTRVDPYGDGTNNILWQH